LLVKILRFWFENAARISDDGCKHSNTVGVLIILYGFIQMIHHFMSGVFHAYGIWFQIKINFQKKKLLLLQD